MKALFRNHFPFVEGTPEEELTPEQLITKQTYDKLYPSDNVPVVADSTQESRPDTKAKVKTNRLREVHADEAGSGNGGE